MLNIFISDLTEYNNGRLTGQWHDLETGEGRQSALDAVNEIVEKGHEHFITDYETEYLRIGEYNNIETLCEAGEVFEDYPLELADMVQELNAHNGSYDHLEVREMADFNEVMDGDDPEDIANKVFFGEFNPMHDYFIFDGRGNLESLSNTEYGMRLDEEGGNIIEDWLYYIHHISI